MGDRIRNGGVQRLAFVDSIHQFLVNRFRETLFHASAMEHIFSEVFRGEGFQGNVFLVFTGKNSFYCRLSVSVHSHFTPIILVILKLMPAY